METFVYEVLYSDGYKPDLTEVNVQTAKGWELQQMGQSPSSSTVLQWWYLIVKKETITLP